MRRLFCLKKRLKNSTEEKFYYKIQTKNVGKMETISYHKNKKTFKLIKTCFPK